MLIHHQDQGREPAYSQAQDIEPAASAPSPQKACRLVDRLSSFRVQGGVPGTIPTPAPSPTPGASDSGEPQKSCGSKMQASGEGWGKREAEAFILPPGAHRGHWISVWENPSRLKASIRGCWEDLSQVS